MYQMRTSFLEGVSFLDPHPFMEFTTTCIGKSVGALRAHKEETEYRLENQGMFGMAYFVYEPHKSKKQDYGGFKYMNSSGNTIRKPEDLLFKPESGLILKARDTQVGESKGPKPGQPIQQYHGRKQEDPRKNGQGPRRESPRRESPRRESPRESPRRESPRRESPRESPRRESPPDDKKGKPKGRKSPRKRNRNNKK
jgi:penicillin-insensitive murein endopeptidase